MTDQSAYLDHTTIQPGDRLVINVREFGFEPTELRHGDIVTVASVTPRGFAHGALVTVITPLGRPIALGYEWLDRPMSTPKEASMTHPTPFAVGDRVVVTDARTTVGTHPLGSGESQYVGQAATVIRVTDFDDYHVKFDDEDLSSMGSWSHAALDLLEDDAPVAVDKPVDDNDLKVGDRVTLRDLHNPSGTTPVWPDRMGKVATVTAVEYPMGQSTPTIDVKWDEDVGDNGLNWSMGWFKRHDWVEDLMPGRVLGDALVADAEAKAATLTADKEAAELRVTDLEQSLEVEIANRNDLERRLADAQRERSSLTQAASDERRRLTGEIDDLNGAIVDVQRGLTPLKQANERLAALVEFMRLNFLSDSDCDKVDGFNLGYTQAQQDA